MKLLNFGWLGFLGLALIACGEDSVLQTENGSDISCETFVESSSSYWTKDSLYSSYVENLSSENYFSSSSFENDSLKQDSVENEEQVCDESSKGVIIKRVVDGTNAYFVCRRDWREYRWKDTTSLAYDFYRTECVMDGTLHLFSNKSYYVCDSVQERNYGKKKLNFRKAEEMEVLFGKGCNSNLIGEEYEPLNYSIYTWICSDSLWNGWGREIHYWKMSRTFALSNCNKEGELFEAIYDDSAHTKTFVCDADSFRVISDSLEEVLQKGCTSWNDGALAKSGSNYICKDGKWRFDSERILFDSISYGGRWYRTVTIGNQVWFAENMSFETKGDSCFLDSCDAYGRRYSMSAAMIVCPEGWHLPNNQEWKILVEFVKARKPNNESISKNLKSKNYIDSRYPGLDSFGFSANVYSFFSATRGCGSGVVGSVAGMYSFPVEHPAPESYSGWSCAGGYNQKGFVRCLKDSD